MRKLTYYAVFEPVASGGFGVYWPDLPGCTSFGKTFQQAVSMASEALGLHVYSMENDGDVLPETTTPPFNEMPEGGIVMPITIFPDMAKNSLDNRAIKTNITLPAWLKDWAGIQGINLSQALQTTLRQMYNSR
jgi:predicted RNase H-like HicB family nuclease